MARPRGVFRSARFELDSARIEPNPELWDDICAGVEWLLARDPTVGEQIRGTEVYAISTRPMTNRREELVYLTFYYAFDDENVTLLSVTQTPQEW